MVPGAVENGYAGGVIAAILETAQAVDQYRDDVMVGDGAYDSTHELILSARLEPGRDISRHDRAVSQMGCGGYQNLYCNQVSTNIEPELQSGSPSLPDSTLSIRSQS
jgi:hypothetical protein